jgi:hypothetical protein
LPPNPVIERLDKFWIVRDDLVPGGTKQIVLRELLPELNETHFVYVASVFGKGGAALAYACAELGFKCTLFISRSNIIVPWVEDVKKLGTKIIWQDLMPVTEIEPKAWNYATQQDAFCLPLGFASEQFERILMEYARKLPFEPKEIWCPIVSGTMAHGLEQAFPDAKIKGVSVVKNHDYKGFGEVFFAPEKFVRGAAIPPPYPAWPYSDAKVWRFAKKHGSDDAVIWNSNA